VFFSYNNIYMPAAILFSKNPVINLNKNLFPKFNTSNVYNSSMKSVFSNNTSVYYKPGSLSSGVGTVRNHRNKLKFT